MVMAFEVLNRLKWRGGLEKCEIVILHRGAPRDRKAIQGSQVTGLDRHYFWYAERGRETTIPLHRIREIRLEKERDGLDISAQAVRLEWEAVWKREKQPKNRD